MQLLYRQRLPRKRLQLLGGFALVVFTTQLARADVNINFQSVFEANNEQSDGSAMDATFTYELGTFTDSFAPDATNTSLWMDFWMAAPNSNSNPNSGSSAQYSTANVPFGGPANAYQGFITLNTNVEPFSSDDLGYFWGYNERVDTGLAEWVLLANSNWTFPAVTPGAIELNDENWLASDAGTFAIVGGVNPDYDTSASAGSQQPHLSSAAIEIGDPVPEPSASLFLLISISLFLRRQR